MARLEMEVAAAAAPPTRFMMSSILLGRRAYGAPATTRVSRLPVLRLGLATTACTLKRLRSMFRRIASCGDCERESEIECTRLLSPVLPSAVRAMMMLIDPRINLLLQAPAAAAAAASSLRSLTSPRANINPLKTLLCQTTAKGAEAVVQSPTQLPASCSGGRSRSRASRKLKQKSSSSVSATRKNGTANEQTRESSLKSLVLLVLLPSKPQDKRSDLWLC